MNCIVTLDVGTTHIKGYLFSSQGEILEQAAHGTPFLHRGKGFSEIDPDKVFEIIVTILRALVDGRSKPAGVDSIVVSGMASSFLPVNRYGKPLYACVCWNDQRNAGLVDLAALDPIQRYIQQYPLPMYLPFRLQWFRENKPDIVTDAYKWMNLTDYIVFHLSAQKQFITDYSQASRTMLFNSLTKRWNSPVLDHFNIEVQKLPTPKPAGFVIGALDQDLAIGSSYQNTQLLLGGHDHMFAALAGGIQSASIALNSTGTSEALILPYRGHESFSFYEEECNLESHVIDNEFFVVGYVASTGSIMEWADKLFGLFKWTKSDLESSWREQVHSLPLFVPSGRRMQPSRAGTFTGLQPSHNEQQFSLAVIEGVCFEAKVLLEHLHVKLNMSTNRLRLVGGASKSIHFLQMKSTILQKPIEVIYDVDMTSLGGFILSGLVLDHFDSAHRAAEQLLCRQNKTLLEPDKQLAGLVETRYELYLRERRD